MDSVRQSPAVITYKMDTNGTLIVAEAANVTLERSAALIIQLTMTIAVVETAIQ